MPLGQLVDKYLAIEVSNKDIKEKTHKEIRRMLNMPELDELKAQSVIEIQRVNLYEMLVDLMNTRTPGMAERVRQRLKDVFEFGLNSGYLPNDFQIPVPTKQLAKTSNKRERVLTSDEIKKLLAWMPDSKLPDTAKTVGDPIGKFREDLGIPHWSIHDLRRTFATGVASLGA